MRARKPGGVVVAERIKRRLSEVEDACSNPNLSPFGVVSREFEPFERKSVLFVAFFSVCFGVLRRY